MAEDQWYRDRIRSIVCGLPYLEHRHFRRVVLRNYHELRKRIIESSSGSLILQLEKSDYQLVFYRPEDLDEALRWLLV